LKLRYFIACIIDYSFQTFIKRIISHEYKLTAIVLDIAGHRLFKPVGIKKDEIDKRSFLKLSFANKG
jgi:hypothetical protein